MKIIIKDERPISWNSFYSGMHWRKRLKEAERVHELVLYATCIDDSGKSSTVCHMKPTFDSFSICLTAYFKSRPLDADNIPLKLYCDGLKGHILMDDNHKFISKASTISKVDKLNPRIEIELKKD